MTLRTSAQAKAIYQGLLDKIWDAMSARDFALYQTYFALPHQVETFEGRQRINNAEDLRAVFDSILNEVAHLGERGMIRSCLAAEFEDEVTIHGSHETHMIDRSLRIVASYPAYSVLRRVEGEWRAASSQYAADRATMMPGFLGGFET